jgi:hypothetical protein
LAGGGQSKNDDFVRVEIGHEELQKTEHILGVACFSSLTGFAA